MREIEPIQPSDPKHDASPRDDFFPTTRWSRILDGKVREGKPALDGLARDYLSPIQQWLRCRLRCGDDDAADAAHDFFVWMIETSFVSKADPGRGRFRAFLKTALRHFVVDRERRDQTQKRGGTAQTIAIDDVGEDLAPKGRDDEPDRALDAAWRGALVEKALADLESELHSCGKKRTFAAFRDYFLADETGLDYAALAARHGLRETDVSNHLRDAKRRFRSLLRRAVTETVRDSDALDEELRWLFEEEKR